MDSGVDFYVDTRTLLLLALLSALVLAVARTVVRRLARRGRWSPQRTTSLTWSVPLGAVAVLGMALLLTGTVAPTVLVAAQDGARITGTLVWLPLVMALLWAVLHALRGGVGRTPPLLDLPPAVAVAALWLVSLPLQITVFTIGLLGALTWVGLALWLVGEALVATGRTTVGDVGVWVGIALVAADAWPGYVGLVSPVVVALLAVRSARRGRSPAVS